MCSDATGEMPDIQRLPLLGVSADCLEHEGVVSISLARSMVDHVTRYVHFVRRIYVEVAVRRDPGRAADRIGRAYEDGHELRATGLPLGGFDVRAEPAARLSGTTRGASRQDIGGSRR